MTMMERGREWIKPMRPVVHLMMVDFLFYAAFFTTYPFLVDIFIGAFCEDNSECSNVILVIGSEQLIGGIGVAILAPILGSVSDAYGRKPLFKIIVYTAILPAVLLAYRRTPVFVYIWLFLDLVGVILRDGVLIPCALAYVGDVVDEKHRSLAMGLKIGAVKIGALLGTMLAYFCKVDFHAFWIAAGFQISVAIYLELFLKESNPRVALLPADLSRSELTAKLVSKPAWTKPSLVQSVLSLEAAKTVWKSPWLRSLALVDFLNSFAVSGNTSFLLYFLKAAFGFEKDEYSVIAIIGAVTAVGGLMLVYPVMAYIFGERQVLLIGLVGTAGQYFLYSFAWTGWVAYLAAAAGIFSSLVQPAICTMVSTGLHKDQQGKIQGFMGGVRALAMITGPSLMTPLAAISLVENAPFHMPGLIFVVCGTTIVLAWLICSLGMPSWTLQSTDTLEQPCLPDYTDVQALPQDALPETFNRIP